VLGRIFGIEEEMRGGWGSLHDELHNLYASPNIIRVMTSRKIRWAWHVTYMGEMNNIDNILVGKPEGKRPLERPGHKWENNTRMYLRETGWEFCALKASISG